MKKLKSMYSSLTRNQTHAFWGCLALTIVALIPFFVSTLPNLGNPATGRVLVGRMIPIVIGVASVVSSWLILQRRLILAGTIFFIGFGGSMLVLPMIVQGFGFIIAAMAFIVCSYLASLILTGRTLAITQYANGFLAILIILVEIYWPGSRSPASPTDFRMVIIVAALTVLIYGTFQVRQFSNYRLQTKLTAFGLVLGIIPMAMIGWMASQVGENALTADADEALTSSATQLAGSIDSFITFNLDSLRTEARLKEVVGYLEMDSALRRGSAEEEELNDLLNAFQQKSPMILSYVLMDRFGIVVTDTSEEDLYHDKSDGVYFREPLRTGLPFVSPVIYPDLGSKASIYFSAPVRNAVGDIIGVLTARYNADVLQQQLLRSGSSSGHMGNFFILLGEKDVVLAHTSSPALMYKSTIPLTPEKFREMQSARYMPADQPLEEMVFGIPDIQRGIDLATMDTPAFSGEFFNQEVNTSGETERAVAVPLTTVPWHMFSIQEEDLLYAPIGNMVRGIVLMGIIVGIISVVLGVLLSRFLTEPINRLATVAEKVAQGDLSVRAPVAYDDEVGTLAKTFNTMASQLSNLIVSLEQRVADRTKALVTSTEVSRRLSTILDRQSLVKEVVEQLQKSFNYYHVHIYLVDESGEYLRLAGGTGDPAQTMLARGHQLPRGKGLVGQAADSGMPVLVSDVSASPGWLPNPLLPATKAELAVPIALGEDVIGVLDVQQNTVGGLQQDDADLLLSIASQIAVALENARSYEETQRRAEREAQLAAISQRIQRTTTAEEALQVAVRELSRALDVPHATARLSMKSGNDNGNGHNHS